jgi:hypothetical protein
MEIEDYLIAVNGIARRCFDQEQSVHENLERMRLENPLTYTKLLHFRHDFMSPPDVQCAEAYLPIGWFRDLPDAQRPAAFILCFDIESEYARFDVATRFQRYARTQPLFQPIPSLFDHVRDGELIDFHCLGHSPKDGEVVEYAGYFGIIDRWLNASLVTTAAAQFRSAPTFVRLHPFRNYKEKPASLLMETTYRSANPKWWKNLSLHVGNRDGGEYVLVDHSPPTQDTLQESWEYRVRKIRSLQVSSKRDDPAHLSVMAEELSEELLDDGMLVGRCLHFDTDSTVGTGFGNSTLTHLDLAINIYRDQRITQRRQEKLADGKVVDATLRCHLYRIEGIPFAAMFSFPLAFFRSLSLTTEWLDNQFAGWRNVFRN